MGILKHLQQARVAGHYNQRFQVRFCLVQQIMLARKIPISTTVRAVDKKEVFRKTDPKNILASDRVTKFTGHSFIRGPGT